MRGFNCHWFYLWDTEGFSLSPCVHFSSFSQMLFQFIQKWGIHLKSTHINWLHPFPWLCFSNKGYTIISCWGQFSPRPLVLSSCSFFNKTSYLIHCENLLRKWALQNMLQINTAWNLFSNCTLIRKLYIEVHFRNF